jgi:hypothetical protein
MDYTRINNIDNSQGGAEKIYVFPFEEYSPATILVADNYLVEFPAQEIYELKAFNIDFNEEVDESYEQKISFQLKKILDTDNFKEFAAKDWRIIIKDNNGFLRMLGLYTGLRGKFSKSLGANRADFNGYNFTFETKEEISAPFLNNLSRFEENNYLQQLTQYKL